MFQKPALLKISGDVLNKKYITEDGLQNQHQNRKSELDIA